MKMKFVSQRNIVLLFYSYNMVAANILYKEKEGDQILKIPFVAVVSTEI